MEKWFTEKWTDNIRFSVRVQSLLHSEQTPFQKLDVFESEEIGRFFTLDDVMMVCEKDEFIYPEMMIHVPMAVHPSIRSVLVIGGGDGGSVRELLKYPSVASIDLVEIDERVVLMCEKYFPKIASGLRDPKVHLFFEDGTAFVKNSQKQYDLIVVDSTDPIGPGEGLFSKAFYEDCFKTLSADGILVNQHESPYFDNTKREMQRAHAKIKNLFPIAKVYQAFIPTYPSGHWLFGFASKRYDPITNFHPEVYSSLALKTQYYNPEIHLASFVLPNYVSLALHHSDSE